MRVLQVIPAFLPATRYGGPPLSVLRLCQGLRLAGVEVELITTDADGPGGTLDVEYDRFVDVAGVPVRYFRRFPRHEYGVSVPLVRFAMAEFSRYDMVHVTPLFTFASTVTPPIARRSGVPYVVSPRGMCMPWSLERRRWKKLPYWHGLERPNLSHAAALHATSEPEAEQLTRLFPDTPVLTVPNAVEVETPTPGLARERGRIVFVGRLHPVKGFDVLIPAMSLLTARVPHAELVLAGPDDHGEWSRIKAAIERCEPRPKVRYVGSVHGRVKADLLGSAEALVLCSHLESFGNVVAEALAVGTPVVVGRRCPWRSVEEEGAGYWVEHTARGVADGLERLLSASDGGNRLRANARRLGATYTAAAIGKTMAHHYERLLDVPARRNEAPC